MLPNNQERWYLCCSKSFQVSFNSTAIQQRLTPHSPHKTAVSDTIFFRFLQIQNLTYPIVSIIFDLNDIAFPPIGPEYRIRLIHLKQRAQIIHPLRHRADPSYEKVLRGSTAEPSLELGWGCLQCSQKCHLFQAEQPNRTQTRAHLHFCYQPAAARKLTYRQYRDPTPQRKLPLRDSCPYKVETGRTKVHWNLATIKSAR